jgi:hypothetical protein
LKAKAAAMGASMGRPAPLALDAQACPEITNSARPMMKRS